MGNYTKKINTLLLLFIFILSCRNSYAQNNTFKYAVEVGGYYSTNNKIPFWLRSNQYGAIPTADNTVLFRQSIESKLDTSNKFFKKNFCFDMVTVVGSQAKIIIPEAYYRIDLGKVAITAGRKKQIYGLVDSTLSSGSITWSGNSLPIPEIKISIPEYRRLFFDWFAIKGHFSHGWFGNQDYVKNYFLHQKSLYARIGKPNSKLKLYGGILHNAQWGGTPKYTVPVDDPRYIEGGFAKDWVAFRNIVFPLINPGYDSTSGYSRYDYENRFGNHLGQIDMGGELNFKNLKILGYKQIIFETGQTFSSLTNIDDGLYGLSFENKKENPIFKKVVFEFLHTTNQGIYRAGLLRLIGFYGKHYGTNQNFYFNHGQYLDGWSYNDLTIGTPFMIPDPEIRSEKRTPWDNFLVNNNRIKALYTGVHAKLNSVDLEFKMSVSRNFGSPRFEQFGTADQTSFAVKASIPAVKMKGLINVGIGIEQGDLINDNYGFSVTFKRFWE
jgi:hypothetical protein